MNEQQATLVITFMSIVILLLIGVVSILLSEKNKLTQRFYDQTLEINMLRKMKMDKTIPPDRYFDLTSSPLKQFDILQGLEEKGLLPVIGESKENFPEDKFKNPLTPAQAYVKDSDNWNWELPNEQTVKIVEEVKETIKTAPPITIGDIVESVNNYKRENDNPEPGLLGIPLPSAEIPRGEKPLLPPLIVGTAGEMENIHSDMFYNESTYVVPLPEQDEKFMEKYVAQLPELSDEEEAIAYFEAGGFKQEDFLPDAQVTADPFAEEGITDEDRRIMEEYRQSMRSTNDPNSY